MPVTTVAVDYRTRIACPGSYDTPAGVTWEPDVHNHGYRRWVVTCRCGFEYRIISDREPTVGWHVRPDAPLHLLLRAAAQAGQHGHPRSPAGFYISTIQDVTTPGGLYWARQGLRAIDHGLADNKVVRITRLLHRYQRFHRYMTEVEPRWGVVDTIRWADNSTDVVERSHDGRTRTRQTVAPHGDTC